jgi:hypothetical protein
MIYHLANPYVQTPAEKNQGAYPNFGKVESP